VELSISEVTVRTELPADVEAIRNINIWAFGRPTEADLVDMLRRTCKGLISLVAVEDGHVVGHILFSPVTINGFCLTGGMGLGPMAVLPEKQRSGIGSRLVREGIERLKRAGCPFVVVLGHPQYYPRFGFVPASRFGLRSQWEGIPDEAFMITELTEGALRSARGVIRFQREFDAAV
jgi:putative acetyltransferase